MAAGIKNAMPPFVNPFRQGRPLHYTPDELAEKFAEYVEWCEKHPITITETSKGRNGDSDFARDEVYTKPRLISIDGFLNYIGEIVSWWEMLDKNKDGQAFLSVKTRIRAYCEHYQKNMASAGIFKENIISRLLGLSDKKELTSKEPFNLVVNSQEEKKKIENIKELDI